MGAGICGRCEVCEKGNVGERAYLFRTIIYFHNFNFRDTTLLRLSCLIIKQGYFYLSFTTLAIFTIVINTFTSFLNYC